MLKVLMYLERLNSYLRSIRLVHLQYFTCSFTLSIPVHIGKIGVDSVASRQVVSGRS